MTWHLYITRCRRWGTRLSRPILRYNYSLAWEKPRKPQSRGSASELWSQTSALTRSLASLLVAVHVCLYLDRLSDWQRILEGSWTKASQHEALEVLIEVTTNNAVFYHLTRRSPIESQATFRRRSTTPSSGKANNAAYLMSGSFLAIPKLWRCRPCIAPKRLYALNGLLGVISQKIELIGLTYVLTWLLSAPRVHSKPFFFLMFIM